MGYPGYWKRHTSENEFGLGSYEFFGRPHCRTRPILALGRFDVRDSPTRRALPIPAATDLTGTTIETCILIMSRCGKDDVLRTEKDGFAVVDREALEQAAEA